MGEASCKTWHDGRRPHPPKPGTDNIGTLTMKDIDRIKRILNEHQKALKERFGIIGIGIFGSFARGEQTHDSDLDVLVSMDISMSLLEWAGAVNYLSTLLGMKVDVVPVQDIRPELKQTIMQEAIPL
ncbi:Nucleotidyltransferase domain protein [Candidatus Magnetobacterium bavaricum]|uniref:Nucleotidyltransferase domain protein n=1 Tax=Candidatus Magnetobacterium bavaricum TaxID=29290 RepID=A0A0F3GRF1_9BACT|nr:Nucleotidyltransferase domain protein [Candidatus Magnetobacterium bavaricum]